MNKQEDYQKALFRLQVDNKRRIEYDIEFLERMKEHLKLYQEGGDSTRLDILNVMISRWLNQLREEVKP